MKQSVIYKKLLSALLSLAMLAALPAVTVALCEDGAPMQPGDLELFSGAKQVAAQLRQLARKNGAQVAAPELLRRDLRHKNAPGLAALTELLETGSCTPPESAPELRLFAAASREEEARCAAADHGGIAAVHLCCVRSGFKNFMFHRKFPYRRWMWNPPSTSR